MINYDKNLFIKQKIEYNKVNSNFNKTLCYHVGYEAGFHFEIDAMMQTMLYCYKHQIKFILYADDANFSGGNGWDELFVPFCDFAHEPENSYANIRYKRKLKFLIKHPFMFIKEKIGETKLRKKYDYLTQDIFPIAINKEIRENEIIKWEYFGINGCNFDEFAKLDNLAMHFNEDIVNAINIKISQLKLPKNYYSIQFRGGDKITEFGETTSVEKVIREIDTYGFKINNLFVMSDNYDSIKLLKKYRPNWNIYTLTKETESGYNNTSFNKIKWADRKEDTIKMFAMIEICLHSIKHFGDEQSCVNNYIRSKRLKENGCISVWKKHK